ncbi:MAG TPA: phosphoribosyltransferase family protein [Armatimonadota bacterium]|jgi:predicted phosphoribosyltransferase
MGDLQVGKVFDLPELRDRTPVFRDRDEVGRVLAGMLAEYKGTDALLLAVPRGALVIGAILARELRLPLDAVVVAKVTPEWNPEFGYGGVAWDGTVVLDETLAARLGINKQQMEADVWRASDKVESRSRSLRGERAFPRVAGRTVILVDDGLATGSTLRVAIRALTKAGADRLVVAVGTGHREAVEALAQDVAAVYCPNLRETRNFSAVGEAYRNFDQVSEAEAVRIIKDFGE